MSNWTFFRPISEADEALATSTTSAPSAAAPARTVSVRLEARTQGAHVRLDGEDATTDNLFLPAGFVEYLPANQGMVVTARSDTGAGVLGISWGRSPS